MTTEPVSLPSNADERRSTPVFDRMRENISRWLKEDVTVRLSRKWIVGAAAAFLVLLLLALD